MKIAIISLPHLTLPGGNYFNTLHGYWKPPNYVLSYWSTGAKVEYINDIIYEKQKKEIRESQKECVNQFWREWIL